ncbi:hypothetical protein SAMD00019534_121770, partial [Acytostelium subglobosum LB1]|uniref:hypothetical protein n=1 Tax=Acytostelium subglobosum LB1 TaxID=1410327 RepID=UPI0006448D23
MKKSYKLYYSYCCCLLLMITVLYSLRSDHLVVYAEEDNDNNNDGFSDLSASILKDLELLAGHQTTNDDNTTTTNDTNATGTKGRIFPPLNLTVEFNNSTVSLPLQMYTENLNVSNVQMYAPYVEFPLTFNSKNMSYDIGITAQNLPMSITLQPNATVVPLTLSIEGDNNIPIAIEVKNFTSPVLNWVALGLLGTLNVIGLGMIIYQQTVLMNLRRRMDDIEVCNDVIKGRRVKVGHRWYHSINNNDDEENSDSSNNNKAISEQHKQLQQQAPQLSNFCLLCSQCGQVNGRTKFCFNCGNALVS